jgi:hypothetical protein
MVQIICPLCRDLVEVVDKIVAEHHGCDFGGMRYVPSSSRSGSSAESLPPVELVGVKVTPGECSDCGMNTAKVDVLVRVNRPLGADRPPPMSKYGAN